MADTSSPPDGPPPVTVHPIEPQQVVLARPRPPRPGDLSLGWRTITAGIWVGVILGLAAVWNTSVQLGLSTWWLGPRAEPQPRVVQFLPFVGPALMLVATINQVRWLAWWGLATSAAVAAVAVGDVGRVTSLAVIEFTIAGAAALVSVASFTGTYRLAEPEAGADESAMTESAPTS